MAPPAGNAGEWTTGLFSCSQDCGVCCLACFCPCIALGQIAETTDRGNISCAMSGALYCCILHATACLGQWMYSCTYRPKLRAMYDLPESPCADCCVHMCCEPCALSQMYRELKNRGIDPAHGGVLNSQKMTSAPLPMQDMNR